MHGGKDIVESFINHDDIAGISFVGSTPIAKLVYEKATARGKRVQSLGNAKNHAVIMPDANGEKSMSNLIDSAFSCGRQRCLAVSQAIIVGKAYDKFTSLLVKKPAALRLGDGLKPNVDLGLIISAQAKDRIWSYIEKGEQEGAHLLLDGRKADLSALPSGHFIGPTIFDNVTPEMTITKEKIFGPVLSICKVKTLDDTVAMIQNCEFGNAASIYRSSGGAAQKFKHKAGPGMLGVNIGVAASMAFLPFGNTENSFPGNTISIWYRLHSIFHRYKSCYFTLVLERG